MDAEIRHSAAGCNLAKSSEGEATVAEWEDVGLVGKPSFLKIDEKASGLNVYTWELSRSVEDEWEWKELFKSAASMAVSFHRPELSDTRVTIRVPEDQLQAYAKALSRWFDDANTKFRTIELPKIEQWKEAAKKQQEVRDERERRAREEAENLNLGDG